MTALGARRYGAPDPAALRSPPRLAPAGGGYGARGRPAPGDPLAWLPDAPRDRRDDDAANEDAGAALARREDDER